MWVLLKLYRVGHKSIDASNSFKVRCFGNFCGLIVVLVGFEVKFYYFVSVFIFIYLILLYIVSLNAYLPTDLWPTLCIDTSRIINRLGAVNMYTEFSKIIIRGGLQPTFVDNLHLSSLLPCWNSR